MRSEAEIKADWLNAVRDSLDEMMQRHGFRRRATSLNFVRRLGDAEQQFVMSADTNPRYQAGAEVHILPRMRLAIPSVSARALELVGGRKMLLANAPEVILNQPFEIPAPKAEHRRWFAAGAAEMREAAESVGGFFERWTLPLLGELTSPADLVRAYETKDERVVRLQHGYVFVAAAYLLTGDEAGAKRVLQENLGSPGLRSRFAPAFEQLGLTR